MNNIPALSLLLVTALLIGVVAVGLIVALAPALTGSAVEDWLIRPEPPDYSKHPDDPDPRLENWSGKSPRRRE